MDTNCDKEKLTHAIIKKDLITQMLIDIAIGYVQLPFYLILVYLVPTFFRYTTLYSIIVKLCWIAFIIIFLIINISTIPIAIKICKGQFIIKKGILYKKEDSMDSGFAPNLGDSYYANLLFNNGEHFSISKRYTYYKWSHSFSMNRYDLFESSRIDDCFTLVTIGKKALIIYNDKFFDTSSIQYSE